MDEALLKRIQSLSPENRKTLELYLKNKGIEDLNVLASTKPAEDSERYQKVSYPTGYYPVSSAQKRLFLITQIEEVNTAYNISIGLKIEGDLDKDRFAESCQELVKRHESLRTSFELIDGEPVQKIHRQIDFNMSYFESGDNQVNDIIQSLIRPYDLSEAPLIRIGLIKLRGDNTPARHIFVIDIHHIISDGASMRIIMKELFGIYIGQVLPELKKQYKEFAAWQNALMGGQSQGEPYQSTDNYKKQEEYWLNIFGSRNDAGSEEIPILNLPTDFTRPLLQSFDGDIVRFPVEEELTSKLTKLASENGASLFMALLASINALLFRYTGQNDIIIGTPVAGRQDIDFDNVVGMFVNTLALRNYPAGEKTFRDLLREVRESSLKSYDNQDYQFETLVEKLNIRRDLSRNPLFDVMFSMQRNMNIEVMEVPGLKIKGYEFGNNVSKFDISFEVIQLEKSIYFKLEYCTRLFEKETIKRLTGHLINILSEVVKNPGVKLSAIDMLTEEEKHRILFEFNDTKAEFPREKTIQQLFEEQVERFPECTAVIFANISLTYGELNKKANCLARILKSKGVKRDSIVGIMVERSPEMSVAIMAVLKAGGAYLPISPSYPDDRIVYMLEDSNAQVLLTQDKYMEKPVAYAPLTGVTNSHNALQHLNVINIEDESLYHQNAGDFTNLENINRPDGLVYVIYTSGSTGKPKGAMIEHHSLVNRLHWMQRRYPIGAEDIILQKTPYTFDVSVWELFWWAIQGAKVCFLKPEGEKDPEAIMDAVEENSITIIHFVPSMLNSFLEYIAGRQDLDKLKTLKRIFASGEALAPGQVKRFNALLNQKYGTKLHNLYGPTEATVDVSYFDCPAGEDPPHAPGIIPIGKPIDNINLYVLDKYNHLQPVGIAGELHIAGEGLARGYLNRPELTAEKFVPNPFGLADAPQGTLLQRMYRTGDLARWMPDGNIEFLGRMDHQVKIRGFRIELGEVESALLKHEAVKEAVVIDRKDKDENKYLCAYIVRTLHATSVQAMHVQELRAHLLKELPEYMIPAYFVKLDKLPLTANGKVDRKALPEPDGAMKTGVEYAPPRNRIEEIMVKLWEEALGRKGIGIDENFFELGGDSIKIIQVTARLQKYQLGVKNRDLFKYPTIRELSGFVENSNLEPDDGPAMAMHVFSNEVVVNNTGGLPEIKALGNFEPFNDVFYKNCFYNAFFPVIYHFGRNDLPILVNDINVYKYSVNGKVCQLEIEHSTSRSEENVMVEMGISLDNKAVSGDIINDLIRAIVKDRPVIICVDCFYESMRVEYQVKHWPHALLIYGYDLNMQIFNIIEHEEINSTFFKKLTISFADIANSYKGYINNFYEGNKSPTYFEFYLSKDDGVANGGFRLNTDQYKQIYINNLLTNNEAVVKGIEDLKTFAADFGNIMANEAVLKESINNLLFDLNEVIKAKTAERYNIAKLFSERTDIVKMIQTIVNQWILIRANLERYAVTTIYDLKMSAFIQEKLKQIYDMEIGLNGMLLDLV